MLNVSNEPTLLPPGLRVLIAERLPLVGALLRDLLTMQPGVTVVAAVSSPGEILGHTRRLTPDLVLLDWTLGGLGTLQALRALRPAPAVIVLIASASAEYGAAVLAHGGAACLPREHLHRTLPEAVAQIIAGRRKGMSHDAA